MSEQDGKVSPSPANDGAASSARETGKETDVFEDAVDNSSARSLTKRSPSFAKPRPEENKADEKSDELPPKVEELVVKEDEGEGSSQGREKHETTPLSPTNRLSQTSGASLDNVNLRDDAAAPPKEEKITAEKEPSKTLSLSSLTSALPSMPWSPPVQDPSPRSHIPPPITAPGTTSSAPIRKLTSPFAWLARNTSNIKDNTSPPPSKSPRRNTASSIATLTSNPEMMLSKLDEEKEREVNGIGKNTLKDRFKMARMRDEAGIVATPAAEEEKSSGGAIANLIGRSGALSLGVISPAAGGPSDDKESTLSPGAPPTPIPTSPNTNLAPGTASGVSAGPSAMAENGGAVDWDFWQAVVYEGPAAVARTSAEELNRAIATGIPSAIRGVIWQVLAQSKNEELEALYPELVARGTDKEKDRSSNGTAVSSSSSGNLAVHKDSITSSASSVHSDHSGQNGVLSPPPSGDKDSDHMSRLQAEAAAERKRKEKEDTAMLQKLEKTIRRDLGARTSYSKFAAASGLQEGLFGVCKAYALFDEGVGYAQGMNFLVMPLLFNMSEEEAFCLLVRLMNHYRLRDLFIQDMPGLHLNLYLFERLLEDLEPALYCHLHRRGISPHLYATQWFLTLFAYRFPLQLVLRIYDLIFSEGLSAVLRFGLVLMQRNAAALLALTDMTQLTAFLKDRLFDAYIDAAPSAGSILENGFFGSSSSTIDKEIYRADELVRDAALLSARVTPDLVRAYTAEWEDKTRVEREAQAELDSLRQGNASLALKVRRLEERVQAADGEQAALATELVHTKVENQELRDENEGLRGQVRELRIVIERQPAEIEEAWKLERDDLMRRNAKVHEENQRVEKELAELEEELVQTKLRYAEINSQHETLTRRWTDLKRQLL